MKPSRCTVIEPPRVTTPRQASVGEDLMEVGASDVARDGGEGALRLFFVTVRRSRSAHGAIPQHEQDEGDALLRHFRSPASPASRGALCFGEGLMRR